MLEPQIIPIGLFAALVLVIFILWVTMWLYKKTEKGYSIIDIIREAGYPSLARFQFTLWTLIVVFCFTTVCIMRFLSGITVIPEEIPANLLALMGVSAGVTAVSTGVSKTKYADETKDRSKTEYKNFVKDKNLGGMLLENGVPSLTRFQMLAWTFLSVFLYISKFLVSLFQFTVVEADALVLPDIEFTLLVLMGISQGAYVGGKWVAPTKPYIFNAIYDESKTKTQVIVDGINFGDNKKIVMFDGHPIAQDKITWDTEVITFELDKKLIPRTDPYEIVLKIGAKEVKKALTL